MAKHWHRCRRWHQKGVGCIFQQIPGHEADGADGRGEENQPDEFTLDRTMRTQEALAPFGFATAKSFREQQGLAIPIPRGITAMPLPGVPEPIGGLLEQIFVDTIASESPVKKVSGDKGLPGSLLLAVAAIAGAMGLAGGGRGGGRGGRGSPAGGGFNVNFTQRINALAGFQGRRKLTEGVRASSNPSPGG